ncbi:MAG: VCBS repeat-containing protein [Planctomycetota bacterium]|nr:MAG: VCBS repeat-containing protein [Planctomycetota bacterium]
MKRSIAVFACGVVLAFCWRCTRADDRPVPLRLWVLRLPGTELGLDVCDADGDGDADLWAAHLRAPGAGGLDRQVSLYLRGPAGQRFPNEPSRGLPVPPDACAFAAGDFDPAPGAELAFLCPGRLVLARGDGELRTVAALRGFFDYPEDFALPVWTMRWDLDGDGLPELLVPVREGYALFKRSGPKASLARVSTLRVEPQVKFGPAFETDLLGRFLSSTSRLRRLVAADVNADGRLDLVAYRGKGLARFLQRSDGSFPQQPDREEPLAVVADAQAQGKRGEGTEAFANVRLGLADVNGDGRADLLATKTVGELGLFETLRTQQLVFLADEEGEWDEEHPDAVIHLKGVSDDPVLLDWDGDGKLDLVLSSYRMDMFSNVRRAVTETMTISYMIFRQGSTSGLLPAEPSLALDAEVPLSQLERRGGIRAMIFAADVDGDGVRDRVARRADGGLEVVRGRLEDGEPGFDEEHPVLLSVGRANPPRVRDLDGDGADELIFEPFADAGPSARVLHVIGVAR